MPARWIELLMRLEATLDAADADLDASDRQLFLDRAFQFVVTHRNRPPYPTADHPVPSGTPLHTRDPTGD